MPYNPLYESLSNQFDPSRIETVLDPMGYTIKRRALPVSLTIAGSDCSGGAGIQADLKTMTSLGVYGMSAITCLVAENAGGVDSVEEMSPAFVESQIDCCIRDIPCHVVKTGMLGSPEIVKAVARSAKKFNFSKLVVDPVMVATSGDSLVTKDIVSVLNEELLPLTYLVTPNIPEAIVLAKNQGLDISNINSVSDMERCAAVIHKLGPKHVLLKGGHMPVNNLGLKSSDDEDLRVVDILYDGNRFYHFSSSYLKKGEVHGTGCTLSSAIASFLAWEHSLTEAVQFGIDYVHGAITHSPPINNCSTNILNHMTRLRIVPFAPGHFIEYILSHPQVVPAWKEYINHKFTNMLAKGTLPLPAFQDYLKQDYLYLVNFARAYSLKGYKENTFPNILEAAQSVIHVIEEKELHVSMCSSYGVSLQDLKSCEESPACTAYSRYILDTGAAQDVAALDFVQAPCLIGYYVIAARLMKEPFRNPQGPYQKWVDNYFCEDYLSAVRRGCRQIEEIVLKLSPERIQELIEIFIRATKFETLFWETPYYEYVTKQNLEDKEFS
ncbi:TENA/THI family protein [Schizosaccharomyces pombe]|uniref:Putative hydroxymethylpyrimidine/phosphomethylpyrimidine kinase 2 n=1 Tax=Schizosaccharomyces pombe (strain 972 / ATCC 24843) TaxID=284812 RepID=THI22_SCHPO|nr:TENA/THI family protein [Schizosaccharomyces pombe]O94266.1 RecName: Full=Putative hydroxymethylpyrimidine/phosphomethylpyrimidine kinase 2; AltName: Full=Hydroxymethylpyrimidine kinase 2; Short=HMP kinase 2; AltName: Full=Hydroxymethylpyrimidine phosphate kinase 2; Short=HMP-P kinase 2; Short=HMP-phosphate kinase 2; Short=HMPP kinase 2 [Schizosaccharomyces pombe 972h-]CAA21803.1 TENA/THI family protein [Schizosaccharomyces pombe]|eukprot:NP_596525.1 TENA/THI family protein [Schizosaccharomyces pombe]